MAIGVASNPTVLLGRCRAGRSGRPGLAADRLR